MVATDLAEALARAGTPFHQAHQIVGRFVLESVRAGKKPADWTAEEMRAIRTGIHRRFRGAARSRRTACGRARFRAAPGRTLSPPRSRAAKAAAGGNESMTKSYRQGQILKLIRSKGISTQEELAQELKSQGIAATQVTLSRDIRDLRLVKTREGYKEMAPEEAGPAVLACWPPSSCATCCARRTR